MEQAAGKGRGRVSGRRREGGEGRGRRRDATRSGKIGRRLARADSLVTVCFRCQVTRGAPVVRRGRRRRRRGSGGSSARVDGEGSGSIRVPALTLGGDSEGGAARRGGGDAPGGGCDASGCHATLSGQMARADDGRRGGYGPRRHVLSSVRLEVPCESPEAADE